MAFFGGVGFNYGFTGTTPDRTSPANKTPPPRAPSTPKTSPATSSPTEATTTVAARVLPASPLHPSPPLATTTTTVLSSPSPVKPAVVPTTPVTTLVPVSNTPTKPIQPAVEQRERVSIVPAVPPPAPQTVKFAEIPPEVQKLIDGWISGGALEEMTTKERVARVTGECFDREEEIEIIANQVACVNKNCVIVSAKPGMGKTTLMNHIAALVMRGGEEVPIGFRNKRIFLIIKPKNVLDIFQKVDLQFGEKCILFCDEVHQIFAIDPYGKSKPGILADTDPEALKPYIGDGRVRLVGFTDRAHGISYNPGFLDDPAWERRFYELSLPDMSIAAAIQVMQRGRATLERKFSQQLGKPLEITDEAIEIAVKLSDWLYPKQQFPDKASHVLEPACAAKMRAAKSNEKIRLVPEDIYHFIMHKRHPKQDMEAIKRGLAEVELRSKMKHIPAGCPLMEYCDDLCMGAATGELQPAYGRDAVLAQLVNTFSASVSNNAVLYGPHGCGKTRIAYGFACLVTRGEVPEHLKGMHVLLLDLAKLLGGTSFRGQLEKRVSAFLRSAKEHLGKYILFVDEFHMVIGAGATKGASRNHIANFFKNALGDGNLPTVGMTNEPDAVREDPAFARRFRFYEVPVFSAAETTDCMQKQQAYIESHYSQKLKRPFKVDPGAIEASVRLGQTMPNEYLPASAFKLLDLACGALVAKASDVSVNKEKAAREGEKKEESVVSTEVTVKNEHIEIAAKEALGSSKKQATPKPVVNEIDSQALSDRITHYFMEQVPAELGAAETPVRQAVANAVRKAFLSIGSEAAPPKVAKGATVAASNPGIAPSSLIDKIVRDQSTCMLLGLCFYKLMMQIGEFFRWVFSCCASRQEVVEGPSMQQMQNPALVSASA